MTELIRYQPDRLPARTGRAVARTEQQTYVQLHGLNNRALVRQASVQAEASITAEKLRQAARLIDVGMSEHTLVSRKAMLYANGDPILADELQLFVRTHQLIAGQIIADGVDQLRRF